MGLTRWDGTAHRTGATIQRWDGAAFRTGATLRRWNGTQFVTDATPDPDPDPVTPQFVGASTVVHQDGSTMTLTVPDGTLTTDLVILASAFTNASVTPSDDAGFASIYGPAGFGSGTALIAQRTGLVAGQTITYTGTGVQGARAALLVYRGYTVGTLGSVSNRSGSSTTSTAPAAAGTGKFLVLAFEKSSLNTIYTAPAVTPATVERAWVSHDTSDNARPSLYVGEYDGEGVDRTLTYNRTSSNGMGVQLRLTPA